MADSILRLQVESQEYDAKLKRATEGLQRYVDGCRKVGGTLEVVEKDTLDYVKAIGQMETVSRSATGKLAEMKKTFIELSMQYKQMTNAERQSPMGKALSQSLDQLNGRIAETKKQMDEVSRDMNGGGGLGGALDALAGKFGLNIGELTKLGTALGAAKVSFDTIKGAIESNEATHDSLARAIEVTDSVTNQFLRTLATADFSTFINGLQGVINKAIDAYNTMDEFESYAVRFQPWQQAKESEISTKIQQARAAKAQGDNKRAEQLNNEAKELINDLAASTRAYGKKQTEGGYATIRSLVGTVDLTDKQIAWYADPKNWEKAKSKAEEYVRIQERIDQLRKQGGSGLNNYKMPGETDTGYTMRVGAVRGEMERLEQYLRKNPSLQRAYIVQNLRDSGDSDEAQALKQAFGNIYGNSLADSRIASLRARADRLDGVLTHSTPGGHGGSVSGSRTIKTEATEKELSIQQQISKLETEAYTATEERRKEIAKLIQQLDKELEKQKAIRDELHGIGQATVEIVQGTNIQTAAGMGSYLSLLKEQQGKAQYGSAEYNALNAQIIDVNTLNNLMKESVTAGVDSGIFDAADELGRDFWTRAMEGGVENIDWQSIVDKINEKRKEAGLDSIKLDFVTGNVSIDKGTESGVKQTTEKHENQIGKVVSGMTSITNSLQHIGVEIPEGFNKVINIMNIIQSVLAMIQASKAAGAAGSFLSNIPILGGLFGLFGAANGGVVHAANGFSGIVPGNLMSGDQVPALLNSGEVVLNRAQAGVLASDMRQGSIGYEGRTQAVVESDQIKLVLRNGAQARGMTLSDYLEI